MSHTPSPNSHLSQLSDVLEGKSPGPAWQGGKAQAPGVFDVVPVTASRSEVEGVLIQLSEQEIRDMAEPLPFSLPTLGPGEYGRVKGRMCKAVQGYWLPVDLLFAHLETVQEGDTMGKHKGHKKSKQTTSASKQPLFPGIGAMDHYPHTSYNSYQPKIIGKIAVMRPDGSVFEVYKLTQSYDDWWELALQVYGPANDQDIIKIPYNACAFQFQMPRFNACTFVATEDYLQARWGRKLHSTDRDWMALHYNATDDGIPTEYTPNVIQQLLEPYGMAISRIRVREGQLVAGEALGQWMQVLGCNPLGMLDHRTSNKDAAAQLGMTVAEADNFWRFEYHNDPLPCSIVGERGVTSSSTVQVGAGGGHARYLAPRSRAGDWVISLQVAPLELVPAYFRDPILPEYKERPGPSTLLVSEIKRPDGQFVGVMHSARYVSPETRAAALAPKPTTSIAEVLSKGPSSGGAAQAPVLSATPGVYWGSERESERSCSMCHTPLTKANVALDSFHMPYRACNDCVDTAWIGLRCPGPKCNIKFTARWSPVLIGRDERLGRTIWQCPSKSCEARIQVKDADIGQPGQASLVELGIAIMGKVSPPASSSPATNTPPASTDGADNAPTTSATLPGPFEVTPPASSNGVASKPIDETDGYYYM